jgi:uncharacterized membrane protein
MSDRSDDSLVRLWLSGIGAGGLSVVLYLIATIYLITHEDKYSEALRQIARVSAGLLAPALLLCSFGMLGVATKRTFGRQ